ncbi:SEC-C metal-binding domain-containing protein [Desulfamplus magnetovallimortis]
MYENDKWYYVDGVLLEPIKIGRNEPCWCQSNKKFKKCHGKF